MKRSLIFFLCIVFNICVFSGCTVESISLVGTTWECRDVMGEDEIYVSIYFMDDDTAVWNDHCDDIFEMIYEYDHPDISLGLMNEGDGTVEMFVTGRVNGDTMALRVADEGIWVFNKK